MIRAILWILTLARVFLVPLFVLTGRTAQDLARAGEDPSTARMLALGLIAFMGVTDLLDGWVARRFDLTSQVGAVADAVADRLVQVGLVAFLTLSVGPVFTPLPFWFLLVVFGRDLVLLVGVSVLRLRYGALQVVHRSHGRIASALTFGVVGWSALGLSAWGLLPLMLGAAGVSVYSATIYALDGVAQARAMSGG
ncbi:MAG: CDP-alcohol phosphatidyltransferase family protein [Gemmatimonadota bacterium]|nr:CDP-alcohol phosphatidyltransferase family protein [Gemmatimonadota bacterium]MDE3005022.1 CDP-alcohol phosphatidyltransferase family protein [Gemmatimonadota bacterium]MDE3014798.1 CDP-alcohol phosphatidyltransferase family protein [Gemmatimonadota bacterium]